MRARSRAALWPSFNVTSSRDETWGFCLAEVSLTCLTVPLRDGTEDLVEVRLGMRNSLDHLLRTRQEQSAAGTYIEA